MRDSSECQIFRLMKTLLNSRLKTENSPQWKLSSMSQGWTRSSMKTLLNPQWKLSSNGWTRSSMKTLLNENSSQGWTRSQSRKLWGKLWEERLKKRNSENEKLKKDKKKALEKRWKIDSEDTIINTINFLYYNIKLNVVA